MKGAMQKIQRFGGAMHTPVLLFSFAIAFVLTWFSWKGYHIVEPK